MPDLLLELFSEEIPARMQADASAHLQEALTEALAGARLAHGAVKSFVTPRRLGILIEGLAAMQPDMKVERKGPKIGAPAQAVEGFCKSVGLSPERLEQREKGKDCFYFAIIEEKGRPTAEALPTIIEKILLQFPWPKSQRWGAYEMQWVRPLRNILCLLDNAVVPVTFGHLTANNRTWGHRFLSSREHHSPLEGESKSESQNMDFGGGVTQQSTPPTPQAAADSLAFGCSPSRGEHKGEAGSIIVPSPADYESLLEQHYVIADAEKRRDRIAQLAAGEALKAGLSVRPDDGLLSEVTGLVEWPVCYLGHFEPKYLDLPPEVPVLEMRHHQKYFALLSGPPLEGEQLRASPKDAARNVGGTSSPHTPHDSASTASSLASSAPPQGGSYSLAPAFLIVSNMIAKDGGERIISGNRKVLRARLEDGRFYWDQDRRKPLGELLPGLEKMIFHARLGSVAEKTARISGLATFLAVFVPHANLGKVERAAQLAKADLISGMVGEFPELQGVMGRYYALEQGEDAEVADAIRDHYRPAGTNDETPGHPVSVTVALADRFDSLAGLFAIGEKPTGSKDPFALRRAAIGIIRIIFDNELRLPLRIAIDHAIGRYGKAVLKGVDKGAVSGELLAFFSERLKVILRDEGVRHDLIDAVFSLGEDDLVRLVARVRALDAFLATDDGANLLAACRRATNIVRKEEEKDGCSYSGHIREGLFAEEEERGLFAALEAVEQPVAKACEQENYTEAMRLIATLRIPLDAFFEAVLVNANDPDIRKNRLHLLSRLRELFSKLADFEKVEG